jgi:hypothetical protein
MQPNYSHIFMSFHKPNLIPTFAIKKIFLNGDGSQIVRIILFRFWDGIFKAEGITDRKKQMERVVEEKEKIINFLTGMENSGKVLFSTFYINPNGDEQHDVVINKYIPNATTIWSQSSANDLMISPPGTAPQ